MKHGFTKGKNITIWAQEDGETRGWAEPFFKGPGSWGRTPGRAARAFARHLGGLQNPGEGGLWWAETPSGEWFGYLSAVDRAADRNGSKPWLAKARRPK
jgi:hypothetical protein